VFELLEVITKTLFELFNRRIPGMQTYLAHKK